MDSGGPTRADTLTWGRGASAALDVGFTLPARWQLGRPLGQGGQAEVWLARDAELSEWVAIKVFRPDLSEAQRERMRREVRLGRSLFHPNLVRVYELLESGDRLAVVMEWVPEGSLAQRLAAGPLPIGHVIQAADDALTALAFLHQRKIVHRDVKPSNLLLDSAGRVRLGDLGLVRSLDAGRELTKTNMAVGTPAYMSPEQLRGEELSPAADLYGLGVTLFELLTGAPPFAADSEFAVAEQHLHAPPRDPRESRADCPRWLARFVLRLLEKRAGDRWSDAGAARRAFEQQRTLVSPRVRRRIVRAALAALGAAALAVVGATVVYPLLRRGETMKVEATGQEVRGLDRRGRVTWRMALGTQVQRVLRADLDGDGGRETVVAAYPRTFARGSGAAAKSEVVVVKDDGAVLTHVSPEDVIADGWAYPFPKLLAPEPRLLDLDGDGSPEVVVLCPQRGFFPFALLVYWPRHDHWDCVLLHSGWIRDVAVVPGSSPPRLRFAGVNNRLGFLPVAGELVIVPPRQASLGGAGTPLSSPELGWGRGERFSFAWYTLLQQGSEPTRLSVEADGGSQVVLPAGFGPGTTLRVDRWGNPDPGPNVGKDLGTLRGWFFDRLAAIAFADQPTDVRGLEARVAAIESEAGAVLAEAPYRAVLGEVHARALARHGRLADGARVLQETVDATHLEEARFRLVQFEALEGRLDAAAALATAMVDDPWGERAAYDGVQLLIRVAVERHDADLLRKAMLRATQWQGVTSEELTSANATFAARAHLWWDEVGEADCTVRSWNYTPEGDALACLARWRRGRTQPGDAAAMERSVVDNPDAAWEGQVALAAAQLGNGKPREAAAALERTIGSLEQLSRDDFLNRQVLDLARGLHVKALFAAGDKARALTEARKVRPTLRNGLLPAILVDEVLDAKT